MLVVFRRFLGFSEFGPVGCLHRALFSVHRLFRKPPDRAARKPSSSSALVHLLLLVLVPVAGRCVLDVTIPLFFQHNDSPSKSAHGQRTTPDLTAQKTG